LRRIPKVGDQLEEKGFLISVEEASERAVRRVRMEPRFKS